MRIGMMVDMYKPYLSGVINCVSLNKRWLEKRGHDVFVFTFGSEAAEADERRVIRSPGLPLIIKDVKLHFSFRHSKVAQAELKTMDVIHVHHPFRSGWLALHYCRSREIPIVFTNHTRYDLYAQHYLPPYVRQVIGQNLLRAYLPAFCQQCDLVIAPSPSLVGVLSQLGITSRVKVIPSGIDLMPFQKPAKQLTRQALGLTAEALVLIYLGRLSPEKNLGFLLRAFQTVAAAQPHVVLLLAGEGPETDKLRREAHRLGLAERVKFLGKIPYKAVPDHLALADIFITASQTETQCLSLVEALASGLPVLGIDSPGVRDAIVDGENGLLSTPAMAVFTDKLRQLVTKPDLRRGLAEKARTTAEKYDIDRTAQAILTEYEALAARAMRA